MKKIPLLLFCAAFSIIHAQENRISNFISKGEYQAAIKELKIITSGNAAEAGDYYILGNCYSALYDDEKASDAFSSALMLEPGNSSYSTALGNSYFASGRYAEAAEYLEKAYRLDTTNIYPLTFLGKVYIASKEYDKAGKVYTELISADSSVSYYHYQLSRCLIGSGDFNEALIHLQISYNLNPKNINVLTELIDIYYSLGYYMPSLKTADRGLIDYPYNDAIYKRRGDINFKLKDYNTAIKDYLAAADNGDSSAALFRNLGLSYFLSGSIDSAITTLNTSFLFNNEDPVTAFYLGLSFKEKAAPDSAVKYLSVSHKLQKNALYGETYIHLGSVYQLLNDYRESLKFYNAALFEMPDRKDILFHLAAVYDKFYADKNTALTYYKRFLNEKDKPDEKLELYAEERIEHIKEKLHLDK